MSRRRNQRRSFFILNLGFYVKFKKKKVFFRRKKLLHRRRKSFTIFSRLNRKFFLARFSEGKRKRYKKLAKKRNKRVRKFLFFYKKFNFFRDKLTRKRSSSTNKSKFECTYTNETKSKTKTKLAFSKLKVIRVRKFVKKQRRTRINKLRILFMKQSLRRNILHRKERKKTKYLIAHQMRKFKNIRIYKKKKILLIKRKKFMLKKRPKTTT